MLHRAWCANAYITFCINGTGRSHCGSFFIHMIYILFGDQFIGLMFFVGGKIKVSCEMGVDLFDVVAVRE